MLETNALPLGLYENFPPNIHHVDRFNYTLSNRQLQSKLVATLRQVNSREYSFEEVTNPTVPNGRLIFEFGLAESGDFNYIDDDEVKKTQSVLSKERLRSMDFFCSIRYYKESGEKRSALKFDYYMLRALFSKDVLEVQVFHERGPRYISPQELVDFLFMRLNADVAKNKKILKKPAT
jgi:hypothetical protein